MRREQKFCSCQTSDTVKTGGKCLFQVMLSPGGTNCTVTMKIIQHNSSSYFIRMFKLLNMFFFNIALGFSLLFFNNCTRVTTFIQLKPTTTRSSQNNVIGHLLNNAVIFSARFSKRSFAVSSVKKSSGSHMTCMLQKCELRL